MIINKQSGFSLLEMSLVLVIIGALFSAFLTPVQHYMQSKRTFETCEQQEKIRQSLLNFSIVHGRLPWAADRNGREKVGKTQGFLPWYTLSLDDFHLQTRHYQYEVLNNWADQSPDPALIGKCDIQKSLNHLSVNFCSAGRLKVRRQDGSLLYDKAVALAYLPHEKKRQGVTVCEQGITWLSAETVLGHLVMAGRLY